MKRRHFLAIFWALLLCVCSASSFACTPSTPPAAVHFGAYVPASVGPSVVTFAPGGTAAPGVYTTWASLYAATSALTGPLKLFCNSALSPTPDTCVVGPAGTYTFASTYLELASAVYNGGTYVEVTWSFPTNVFINTVKRIDNCVVAATGSTTPIALVSSAGISELDVVTNGQIDAQDTAPAVTISGGGMYAVVLLGNGTIAHSGTATSSLKILDTTTVILNGFSVGVVAVSALGAPTAAQFLFAQGSGFAVSGTSQPGILNTGLMPAPFQRRDDASRVGYTSGVTVKNALDLFQRKTTTLSSGVSPAVAATITANSRIVCTTNTPSGAAIGILSAPVADRVVGAPGSFVVRSFSALNVAVGGDGSTVDCTITD